MPRSLQTFSSEQLPYFSNDHDKIKGSILLVDDDSSVLETLTQLIEQCGYKVTKCTGAESAKKIMTNQKESFDILMTDLRMPGEDGISLVEYFGSQYPTLVGILFTGCTQSQNAIRAIRAGAIDFLPKPITIDSLHMALARGMTFRNALIEKERKEAEVRKLAQARGKELAETKQHLEDSYQYMLEALVSLLEAKEKTTGDHTRRVVEICLILGQALALSPRELEILRRAAFLHDIGKIGIPDHILAKPGPLTKAEWELMQTHVEIGYRVLSRNPYLKEVAEIVRCHHERYDGSGYPRGLKGEEIPLAARIFIIADIFDGICSPRSYHPAQSIQESFAQLYHEKQHFDPKILKKFSQIIGSVEKIYPKRSV
ncbi:MAG: HD domain-containing protein [Opitutales bacterium]|nr:HD domain-containing protein [Opitutales bacterium]MCH8539725.1 HD domain-containing protein [Opitutales bacterium]